MILTSQKSRNYATSLYSSSLSTFDNSRSRPRPITLRLRLGFLGVPCGLRLFYSSFDFVSLTVPRPSIPASPPLAVIGSLWQHIALSIQASLTLAFIGAISFAGDSMSPSRNRPLCLHCRSAIAGFLWRTASHLLKLRLRLAFVGDSMSPHGSYALKVRQIVPSVQGNISTNHLTIKQSYR